MDIKKLEKAAKLFEKLKVLDAEIIEIDKIAMLVANGESTSSFTLNVADLVKQKEESEKVEFDADGSIVKKQSGSLDMYASMLFRSYMPTFTQEKKVDNVLTFSKTISENTTLSILGILLFEKTEQRKLLIEQLLKYGVVCNH